MPTAFRSPNALPSFRVWCIPCVLLALALASVAVASPQSIGVLLLPAGTLALTTPDPPNVEVHPCDELDGMVLSPQHPEPLPASLVEVVVRNSTNNPIQNATVVVELSNGNPACPDADLTATTDAAGRAFLTLAGGGCSHQLPSSGVIKANGVTIRAYANVKSPDFDGSGGNLVVDLSDLVVFSNAFLGGSGGCHDYDNNGVTNLADLVIFSPAFAGGSHCP